MPHNDKEDVEQDQLQRILELADRLFSEDEGDGLSGLSATPRWKEGESFDKYEERIMNERQRKMWNQMLRAKQKEDEERKQAEQQAQQQAEAQQMQQLQEQQQAEAEQMAQLQQLQQMQQGGPQGPPGMPPGPQGPPQF